jgi:hypothetical protein
MCIQTECTSEAPGVPHVGSMIVVLSCISCTATVATPGHAGARGNVADKLPTGWTMAPERPGTREEWPSIACMLWAICPACPREKS